MNSEAKDLKEMQLSIFFIYFNNPKEGPEPKEMQLSICLAW